MNDWTEYNWFWQGLKSTYDTCCIFFFMNVWQNPLDLTIKKEWTSTCDGYIPCPDCLAKYIQEEKLIKELKEKCIFSTIEIDIIKQKIRSR